MAGRHNGRWPDLLVIGAGKCGTTALHDYLGYHPEIFMSHHKELGYFSGGPGWARGATWYQQQFQSEKRLCGESSPAYTYFPLRPGTPQRIHAQIPQVKLIYSVRDPIRRLLASYQHSFADGRDTRSLADALANFDNNRYLLVGRYELQLSQYLPFFPLSQIHIVCLEELAVRPREVMQGLFRFLEVDDTFDTPAFYQPVHDTASKRHKGPLAQRLYRLAESWPFHLIPASTRRAIGKIVYRPITKPLPRPELPDDLRARLQEYFAPDVARLRMRTGRSFDGWSV